MPNALDVVLARDKRAVANMILYNGAQDLWDKVGYIEAFTRYPSLLEHLVEFSFSFYKEDAATLVWALREMGHRIKFRKLRRDTLKDRELWAVTEVL